MPIARGNVAVAEHVRYRNNSTIAVSIQYYISLGSMY